jgi:hypothetical protein
MLGAFEEWSRSHTYAGEVSAPACSKPLLLTPQIVAPACFGATSDATLFRFTSEQAFKPPASHGTTPILDHTSPCIESWRIARDLGHQAHYFFSLSRYVFQARQKW